LKNKFKQVTLHSRCEAARFHKPLSPRQCCW